MWSYTRLCRLAHAAGVGVRHCEKQARKGAGSGVALSSDAAERAALMTHLGQPLQSNIQHCSRCGCYCRAAARAADASHAVACGDGPNRHLTRAGRLPAWLLAAVSLLILLLVELYQDVVCVCVEQNRVWGEPGRVPYACCS